MKKTILALAMLMTTSYVYAETNVGVSVSVGEPGFYGSIDINNYPRPQVIYTQPRVIRVERVPAPPVYLRVPPGHRKHWDKFCGRYDACDRPVYFVTDSWYNTVYVPEYHRHEESRRDDGRRDDDRGHDNDDHDNRGNHGNGHGNGHGNKK